MICCYAKEQDEGDLNKDLASLRENLSAIKAEIATHQAQIDTAREKATNRANAYAERILIEAESEAKANAALLEAQALDIKAINSARFPEILEYRYQQEVLDQIESVAGRLPQIFNVSAAEANKIDFMDLSRQMLGVQSDKLYSDEEVGQMRGHVDELTKRITNRKKQIDAMTEKESQVVVEEVTA